MLHERISHLHPCREACDWLDTQPDAETAWRECKRGDWMLWLIGKQIISPPWSEDRKPYLACALDCAALRSAHWSRQTRDGVAVLRAWIAGTASVADAKAARHKLRDAYDVAADAAYAAGGGGVVAAYAAADAADLVRKHYPTPPA